MARYFFPTASILKKSDPVKKDTATNYWIKDPQFKIGTKHRYIDKNGKIIKDDALTERISTRPCVNYSIVKNEFKNLREICGKLFGEFGECIGPKLSSSEADELESLYRSNCLLTTGKIFRFLEAEYKEYYYQDEKYVRKLIISGNQVNILWFKIQPVTWIINKELDVAIMDKSFVNSYSYEEAEKFLNEKIEEHLKPSTLDNLKKENVIIPINREDISIEKTELINQEKHQWTDEQAILMKNLINSIPMYNGYSCLSKDAYIYESDFEWALVQYTYEKGSTKAFMNSLFNIQDGIDAEKSKNSDALTMLNYLNEWIYVLKTDTHNFKYDNSVTNRIINLKKYANFDKEKRDTLYNELSSYKESIINNNINKENEIEIFNIDDLEEKVKTFIKENYNDLYMEAVGNSKKSDISRNNPKQKEIQEILDEINVLIQNYPDKNLIMEKIKELSSNYNGIIDKEVPKGLTLEYVDKNMAFESFKHELISIRNELKLFYKEYGKYLLMLNLIEEWKKALKPISSFDRTNSIARAFNELQNIVFPYLDTTSNSEKYRQMLIDILKDEEKKIHDYIHQKNINGYKDVEDFENKFRLRYQEYLLELNKEVRTGHIVNDIRDAYADILNNKIVNTNNKYIETLLKPLNDILKYIEVEGNNEEKEEAKRILSSPIDYSKNIESILNEIKYRYGLLYKIGISIREKAIEQLEENQLRVNISL